VRTCHRLGVPFVARGSGTSLSGGSLPVEGGIVIALNRMNRVLRVDPVTRIAVVEPGAINLHGSAAAARHGLAYASDPSSQSVCTIGGTLAFHHASDVADEPDRNSKPGGSGDGARAGEREGLEFVENGHIRPVRDALSPSPRHPAGRPAPRSRDGAGRA
jgi:hypothetical protein